MDRIMADLTYRCMYKGGLPARAKRLGCRQRLCSIYVISEATPHSARNSELPYICSDVGFTIVTLTEL